MDNGKVEKGVLKNSHLCKYEETIYTHIYIATTKFWKNICETANDIKLLRSKIGALGWQEDRLF